jgi:hypothetical protein
MPARIRFGASSDDSVIMARRDGGLASWATWTAPIALTQTPFAADRISNLQSRASQSYVLDVLYSLYVGRNYAAVRQQLEQSLVRQGIRVKRGGPDRPTLVPIDSANAPSWLAEGYVD